MRWRKSRIGFEIRVEESIYIKNYMQGTKKVEQ